MVDSCRHKPRSRKWFWILLFVTSIGTAATAQDMGKTVPEDAILYVGLSGRDHAAKAENGTAMGAIRSHPQYKAFSRQFWDTVGDALHENVLVDEAEYAATKRLTRTLYKHPVGLTVIDLEPGPMAPNVELALIAKVGDDGPDILTDVAVLLRSLKMAAPMETEVDGRKVFEVQLPFIPGGARYGIVEGHLVIAFGQVAYARVRDVITGAAPSLADGPLRMARAHVAGDDSSRIASVYVNAARAQIVVRNFVEKATNDEEDRKKIDRLFKVWGLDEFGTICAETHFRGKGCTSSVFVQTGEKIPAILGSVDGAPLDDDIIRVVPKGATWAMGSRLGGGLLDLIRQTADAVGEDVEALNEPLEALKQSSGVDLEADLLKQIGDTMVIYDDPQDGGLLFTGITLLLKVKDHERFRKSVRKLLDYANSAADGEFTVTVRSDDYRDHPVEFVNVTGIPMPFAPAWSVHDGWLIVGLYPQMVRSVIDRAVDGFPVEKSLMAHEGFVHSMEMAGPLGHGFTYSDTRIGIETLYSFALPVTQMGLAMAQAEGIDVDAGALPSCRVFTEPLFPDVGTVSRVNDGLLFRSHGPFPVTVPAIGSGAGFGSLTASVMVTSIALPSLSRARILSKRLVSQSNLKQIGFACHEYANMHDDAFPPDLQTLVDEGLLEEESLHCPMLQGSATSCYAYVKGQRLGDDTRNVLAHELRGLNNDEGVNVLLLDGSARFVNMPEFDRLLAETEARMAQPTSE